MEFPSVGMDDCVLKILVVAVLSGFLFGGAVVIAAAVFFRTYTVPQEVLVKYGLIHYDKFGVLVEDWKVDSNRR